MRILKLFSWFPSNSFAQAYRLSSTFMKIWEKRQGSLCKVALYPMRIWSQSNPLQCIYFLLEDFCSFQAFPPRISQSNSKHSHSKVGWKPRYIHRLHTYSFRLQHLDHVDQATISRYLTVSLSQHIYSYSYKISNCINRCEERTNV